MLAGMGKTDEVEPRQRDQEESCSKNLHGTVRAPGMSTALRMVRLLLALW